MNFIPQPKHINQKDLKMHVQQGENQLRLNEIQLRNFSEQQISNPYSQNNQIQSNQMNEQQNVQGQENGSVQQIRSQIQQERNIDLIVPSQNIEIPQGIQNNQEPNEEEDSNNLKVYTKQEQRQFIIQGYVCIIGGIALHILIGILRVWGCILPYVSAYFKYKNEQITASTIALTFPFMILGFTSVSTFGIKIGELFGFKIMIFISTFCISLAFIIASFLTNIWIFILIFSLLLGLPTGLIYMLPISNYLFISLKVVSAWRFFPDNRRSISFLILAAQGIGTFIFNYVAQNIVNQEDETQTSRFIEDEQDYFYFSEQVAQKIPQLFRIFALLCGLLGITASVFVKYPNEIISTKQRYQKRAIGYYPTVQHSECESLSQGIKSRPFFICIIIIWSSCQLSMLVSNIYKMYGLTLNYSDKELTTLGSIAYLISACLKIFWEVLEGKVGFKVSLGINALIGAILSVGLAFNWNYFALVIFVMILEAGLLATFPIITSKIWGEKIGPIIYGILFSFVGFSNLTIYVIWKTVFTRIHYSGVFFICLAFQILTLICAFIIPNKYQWKKFDNSEENQ